MRRGEQGFTLVEVVVAMVVSALLLGLVMNAALEAKARSVVAKQRRAASLLASSLVEERLSRPYDASPAFGREGDLEWQVREQGLASDPRGLLTLAQIEVVVRDSRDRVAARLEARRLKALP